MNNTFKIDEYYSKLFAISEYQINGRNITGSNLIIKILYFLYLLTTISFLQRCGSGWFEYEIGQILVSIKTSPYGTSF